MNRSTVSNSPSSVWHNLLRPLALALLAVSGLVPPVLASDGSVGFVLDVSGRWEMTVAGKATPVARGQALPSGATLTSATPKARITVVLLDGDRMTCPADTRCKGPIHQKELESSTASRLVAAISGLFSKPERYATTMSRGEELAEAVMELDGDRVMFADALRDLPPGPYNLRVAPLPSDDDDAASTSITVSWNPAAADTPPSRLPNVAPGLHRITLDSDADAWVLLVPPSRYRDASAQFAEARSLVASWGNDVPRASTRAFLRAALQAIGGAEARVERAE